jgi:hypothetical protein
MASEELPQQALDERTTRHEVLRVLTFTSQVAAPPEVAWGCFVSELWIGGAGVGPRPHIERRGEVHGLGCTRRVGPSVREGITATDFPQRLEYRVLNPSWTTFPVEHHLGTVAFVAVDEGATEVRWRVEVVPKRGVGPFVVAATRYVIARYLKALERACAEAASAPRP